MIIESALPPYSIGARDDLIQRRVLDAYLTHWDGESDANPISSITGKPMIEEMMLWAWDARPHPAFPARADVWADGASWRLGHWLNGRAGLSGLGEVVLDVCARAGFTDVDVTTLRGAVSGYVVDAPMSARDALEPLMAAYDFTAAEREGRLSFFHRETQDLVEVGADDMSAASAAEPFAQRGDPQETAVEARVRFLDAARDYLIAGVSARRMDAAEGGVASIEAPLVLEPEAAEVMAQRVLADQRAHTETLRLELGPHQQALEPGDRVRLSGRADVFEVERIEEAEILSLELRRARDDNAAQLGLADPNAPAAPQLAPTPAVSILDLPPLPSAEDDDRPLAAVFASPWFGAHDIYAGASTTQRGAATQAAVMGELLWALWPGPVDRWDDGNVTRIKLYAGALSSATKLAVLNGANVFAIEAGGEWEIIQAQHCVLVAPGEYELSGLMRGRLGSAHAMAAPHPVGARIVLLDQKLARLSISAHEWGEALEIVAPPAGGASTHNRAARFAVTLPHVALRPWAPAHVRARRDSAGDVAISWVRCARIGGDSWGPGEPPLGEPAESYLLEVLEGGGAVVRTAEALSSPFIYTAAQQSADFGAPPASLRLRIGQIAASGALGLNKELTIPL